MRKKKLADEKKIAERIAAGKSGNLSDVDNASEGGATPRTAAKAAAKAGAKKV